MKTRLLTLIALVALVAVAFGAMPTVNKTTPTAPTSNERAASVTGQYDWQLLRTVTASDTPLSNTTKAWGTIKSKFARIPYGWNGVRISCYADGDSTATGDPNGGSFSYKVMVCDRNSSAQLVGTGTWAIGELALSHNPALATETALTYGITDPNSSKWGELPVVSTNEWGGLVATGTSNDVGEVHFDARGAYGFYVEVTSLAGITNLYILARGY